MYQMRDCDLIACVELHLETHPDPSFGSITRAVRDESGWVLGVRESLAAAQRGLWAVLNSTHPHADTAAKLYAKLDLIR